MRLPSLNAVESDFDIIDYEMIAAIMFQRFRGYLAVNTQIGTVKDCSCPGQGGDEVNEVSPAWTPQAMHTFTTAKRQHLVVFICLARSPGLGKVLKADRCSPAIEHPRPSKPPIKFGCAPTSEQGKRAAATQDLGERGQYR